MNVLSIAGGIVLAVLLIGAIMATVLFVSLKLLVWHDRYQWGKLHMDEDKELDAHTAPGISAVDEPRILAPPDRAAESAKLSAYIASLGPDAMVTDIANWVKENLPGAEVTALAKDGTVVSVVGFEENPPAPGHYMKYCKCEACLVSAKAGGIPMDHFIDATATQFNGVPTTTSDGAEVVTLTAPIVGCDCFFCRMGRADGHTDLPLDTARALLEEWNTSRGYAL